jgi:multidrug efflux pump subunit AcrA (membrane-fusion protein)
LASKSLPSKSTNKRSNRRYWIAGLIILVLAVGTTTILIARPSGPRTDVILYKVKKEPLNVSVTEKGTLESSANTDLICKVRAGTKGFATTINWVIDDGTRVNPGDQLMILDDSALKDSQESQEIVVAKAQADDIKTEKDYEIQLKANEINIEKAKTDLSNAEIALERLLGIAIDTNLIPLAAVAGIPSSLSENGSYRQSFDDLNGKITQALSDLEQNRERSAWSERMVKQAYMSPAQAEADKSRLESSMELLRSLRAQKALMINYDRRQQIVDLTSKRDNARRDLEKADLTAKAQEIQTLIAHRTAKSVYIKERDKLDDIIRQREECQIFAPRTILAGSMVVYFKPEGNRFGNQTQALIEQGAQVKEGQKMLRIPNLSTMQINTKIHEAMVSRIRGDNRIPTRIVELYQVGMLTNLDLFGRAFATRQSIPDKISSGKVVDQETEAITPVHDHEFQLKESGQRTIVRIDARPDKRYLGHVKSVSQIANQNDVMMSDVKLYPTLVIVDNDFGPDGQLLPVTGEILKPDMTAEVTISVDAAKEPVLTIPLQTIIGGAEMGATREVFVKNDNGYERKAVTLGLYNDKMVEVRDGLSEGDEVVINPKVLLGDSKTKTRDGNDQKSGKGRDGKDGNKEGSGDPTKKGKKLVGGGGGPGGPKA